MKIYDDLIYRGLINDISSPLLEDKLNAGGMTFYVGTDPTADSLHIGHYSTFLMAVRLSKAGHNPILLVGGGTGLIGDPRPTSERPMITKEEVEHNFNCLKKQAESIFGFDVVNNNDWYKNINFIEFLRDVGKYFNINYMLAKDTVKRRLDTGITYTEFSYMLMQAMDFAHLYENKGCNLQVAGSDQWGNITAGIELVRKKLNKEVYGFTMPLVTKSDGTKFSKSEGTALWLDIDKTSAYEMYQFFYNAEDSMVVDYLKKLTLLEKDEIEKLAIEVAENPQGRKAQIALAKFIITFLHDEQAFISASNIATALFNNSISSLSENELVDAFKEIPAFDLDLSKDLTTTLIDNNIVTSKRQLNEFYESGSVLVNDTKINSNIENLNSLLLFDKYIVIKRGKKNYYLGKISN